MVRIAREDDFGTLAGAGENGFDFVGGEVLGFVHNQKLFGNRTTPNESEWFDLQEPLADHFFVAAPPVFGLAPAVLGAKDEVKVIVEGLHPGIEFFGYIPRQVANIPPHGNDGAGNQQPRVEPIIGHLLHPGSNGQ